jgi:hypothetical protein
MLDFAKAFDSVPHRRLLYKVRSFGIHPRVCKWFAAFLGNRFQQVVHAVAKSVWLPVTSGVPQGSVAGPLLFSLFINDIYKQIHHTSTVNLFADDGLCHNPGGPRSSFSMVSDVAT